MQHYGNADSDQNGDEHDDAYHEVITIKLAGNVSRQLIDLSAPPHPFTEEAE